MSPQGQALDTARGDRGLNPLRMKPRTWGMWGTPGPAEWLTAAVTAGKQGDRPEGTRQRAPTGGHCGLRMRSEGVKDTLPFCNK